MQRDKNGKDNFMKENKIGSLAPLDIKIYYKCTISKVMFY